MNVAHIETRDQRAARSVINKIDIRISPPGKFNAAHQTRTVSARKRERAGDLSILETNGRARPVDLTLQMDLARALRGRLRAAHG